MLDRCSTFSTGSLNLFAVSFLVYTHLEWACLLEMVAKNRETQPHNIGAEWNQINELKAVCKSCMFAAAKDMVDTVSHPKEDMLEISQ